MYYPDGRQSHEPQPGHRRVRTAVLGYAGYVIDKVPSARWPHVIRGDSQLTTVNKTRMSRLSRSRRIAAGGY